MPRLRNATLTTIAPTGTLSLIADCSSGIEPLFALAYKRRVLDTVIYETNRHFFRAAEERGFISDEIRGQVLNKGSLKGIKGVPPDVKRLFRTAHDIPPEGHIRMQAAFQKYTDNAVSKTINIPMRARVEDVGKAFLLAYELGCKGITVFRHGSEKKGTLQRLSDTD
jgi:ribonucleoside-diphosphate reductase alpha chain